jgi:hypothetical protein
MMSHLKEKSTKVWFSNDEGKRRVGQELTSANQHPLGIQAASSMIQSEESAWIAELD